MDYLVLGIQAIICVASYVIADYMVTHRTGLAKGALIGKDEDSVVLEMLKLAVATFREQKEENTKLKDYTISVTFENGEIVSTMVETERTILTYNPKDGERITNKAFTEKGLKILYTIFILVLITLIYILLIKFFQ